MAGSAGQTTEDWRGHDDAASSHDPLPRRSTGGCDSAAAVLLARSRINRRWHGLGTACFRPRSGNRPSRFVADRKVPHDARGSDLWIALKNNWSSPRDDPDLDRAGDDHGAVVNQRHGARSAAHRLIHADMMPLIEVANIGCSSNAIRLLRPVRGLFGLPAWKWLGSRDTARWCLIAVTGGRNPASLMIFYLAALRRSRPIWPRPRRSRAPDWQIPPRHLSAVDADHAVSF